MLYFSDNEQETETLGFDLAKTVKPGAVICLSGELGAGKTVFARGFARGLGYTDRITSPTFCILNEYGGQRMPLYHFDAYRVKAGDMNDIGFDEYIYGNGCCLIEWAENIAELIPDYAVWVKITIDGERRKLRVES
jgi:tRNA threonylcarbamoyladenosine biosynthesis protein TsaE